MGKVRTRRTGRLHRVCPGGRDVTDPLVLGLLKRHLLIYISQRLCASLQLLIALPDVALALGVIWRRFWPVLFILHRNTRGEIACQMSPVHLPHCCTATANRFLSSSNRDVRRNGQCWPQASVVLLLGKHWLPMHTLEDKRLDLARFGSVSEGALACELAAALSFHDVAKPVTKAACRDFSSAGSTIGDTTDSMKSMLIDGLQRSFAVSKKSCAAMSPFGLCCQRNYLQISLLGLLLATLRCC